jgi:hypothetical protein
MKKLLALLICLHFLFTFASAEELFTDEMAVQFQNASVGDLASDFVFGMLGLPMEEIAKSSDESKLENLCIVFDRIADISEYAEEYFAFELKKANEEAAAPFVAKEVNVAALDLSKLSFQELTDLKDRINLAIWNSREWQEVVVPEGVWQVGEDIPAGHWVISALGANTVVRCGTKLDEAKKEVTYGDFYFWKMIHNPDAVVNFNPDNDASEFDIDLPEGCYVSIERGRVVFTPYAGKPSLGFK